VDQEADWRFYTQALTKRGYVVFEAGSYDKTATPETWNMVTKVHQRKIELSDIVAVIYKPGKITGSHTKADIEYGMSLSKVIVPADSLLEVSTEKPEVSTENTTCKICGWSYWADWIENGISHEAHKRHRVPEPMPDVSTEKSDK
jgi:hypothetical protein